MSMPQSQISPLAIKLVASCTYLKMPAQDLEACLKHIKQALMTRNVTINLPERFSSVLIAIAKERENHLVFVLSLEPLSKEVFDQARKRGNKILSLNVGKDRLDWSYQMLEG